ncbi:MAG: serine/threonine-protein phosphatase, partial [Carboxylicivirga sp.]|nr:serine/threonine-protein phosphatase [Carboxylicivirga sp.]
YNLITRRLSYVNAGHLPPLLYDARKHQLVHLENGCIGLGMLDVIPSIELGKIHIPKGSKLLAFTDGLVELDDGHQVESGAEEVEAILNNPHPLEQNFQGLRNIIDRIENDGAAFDDISLIGLEFQ